MELKIRLAGSQGLHGLGTWRLPPQQLFVPPSCIVEPSFVLLCTLLPRDIQEQASWLQDGCHCPRHHIQLHRVQYKVCEQVVVCCVCLFK